MTRVSLLLLPACCHCTILSAQKDSSFIILQGANVIDGISKKPSKNVDVVIKRGKITSIRKHRTKNPLNAIVINLANKWLIPGYIDAHVHFFNIETAQNALSNGITTARTMQCDNFLDTKIREPHRNDY